ncbi:MAG: Sugar phosphate isomerase/epimerase [Candidatus Tokpelaia sp. JSC161]|jgi:sugar phosphate isomerase/epimerase|nr:MAG: Sugar phosphate isomerase/epimerase [Candidatus Tokpelaia sp. JSC161]
MPDKKRLPIKGPAIFLAQFLGMYQGFDNLSNLARWAAELGYQGIQVPCDPRLIDLDRAASSRDYCDELKGMCAECNIEITELSTHLQGQLVAVHPVYAMQFEGFAPESLRGKPKAQSDWAASELKKAARAAKNLGHNVQVGFSGGLAWPYLYPWPQRPPSLIDEAFTELGKRWNPILNAFDEAGVDYAYELHPAQDLMDGTSFERFLEITGDHSRVAINYDPSHFILQQLDYLQFIEIYASRIRAFHVKDAEFKPTGRQGVYSGFSNWVERAGRFRSLGDGQVDFKTVFSRLCQHGYKGWAVLEWECPLKSAEQSAKEGVDFIRRHIINPTKCDFDHFAEKNLDRNVIRDMLGICL